MKLSEIAWKTISPTFNKIVQHPFIQEISLGTLSLNKFAYYMEQDFIYLRDYTKCNSIILKEISYEYKLDFIKYTKDAAAYTKYINQYFLSHPEYKSNLTTTATEGYTAYLMKICLTDSVEETLAAILACEWIYKDLGVYLYNNCATKNPYETWIENLVDPQFIESVEKLINIFDDLGSAASDSTKKMMLDIFNKSSNWEFYFFDDSYEQQIFGN